jgi:hypothetical protein
VDLTLAHPQRHSVTPWRERGPRRDALGVACDVRLSNPATVYQMLLCWPTDRIVEALLTAAAMIDIDQPPSHLLEWDTAGLGSCNQGHPWTHASMHIDGRTGHRRCRICHREYRAAKRAEAAA